MIRSADNSVLEVDESRCLLFDDDVVREQLLAGLTSLSACFSSPPPFLLRLVLAPLRVAARFPTLGTLLLVSPRRLDAVLTSALSHWLRAEEPPSPLSAPPRCRHVTSPSRSAAAMDCPLCKWTTLWPPAFWCALRGSRAAWTSVELRCAVSALPSLLSTREPLERPADSSIGSGQWVRVVGGVVAVFFATRGAVAAEPFVEMHPFAANRGGVIGQPPLWLDLALLPRAEVAATAIVGERVDVVGLLDVHDAGGFGAALHNGRGARPQLVLEARAVHTARWTPPYALPPPTAAPRPAGHDAGLEAASVAQALCCWTGVAAAAAFAAGEAAGGSIATRSEALLAALPALDLPPSLWAALGSALATASSLDAALAVALVGPHAWLATAQALLLQLAAETAAVVPLVPGAESALLPQYARRGLAQLAIPVPPPAHAGRLEVVRAGLLSAAHRRIVFAPSLRFLAPTALHALRAALDQRAHIVTRDGGRRVSCLAAIALVGLTDPDALAKRPQLFHFVERCDVVVHVPLSALPTAERQREAWIGALPNSPAAAELAARGAVHWAAWREWMTPKAADDPIAPIPSAAAAGLMRAYFTAAKARCPEAVDASMMSALVKLACAHAFLRHRAHGAARLGEAAVADAACACRRRAENEMGERQAVLIDAVVALSLCDSTLQFVTGVTLLGEPSILDLLTSDEEFDIVQYVQHVHAYLIANIPGSAVPDE